MGYYVHPDSMYHNPSGLLQELATLERKYQEHRITASQQIDHAFWCAIAVRMAFRSGCRAEVMAALREGFRRASARQMAAALIRRGLDSLTRRLMSWDDTVDASWLHIYQQQAIADRTVSCGDV